MTEGQDLERWKGVEREKMERKRKGIDGEIHREEERSKDDVAAERERKDKKGR